MLQPARADVAELVDARDLKSLDGNVVRVRFPPSAPEGQRVPHRPGAETFADSNFSFQDPRTGPRREARTASCVVIVRRSLCSASVRASSCRAASRWASASRPVHSGPISAGPVHARSRAAGPVHAGSRATGPVHAWPRATGPVNDRRTSRSAPAMPSDRSAPARSSAPVIATPIPAGTMPAVPVPTVTPAPPHELNVFNGRLDVDSSLQAVRFANQGCLRWTADHRTRGSDGGRGCQYTE